jgi:hypothetical protein
MSAHALSARRRRQVRSGYIVLAFVLTAVIGNSLYHTCPHYEQSAVVLVTILGRRSAANGYAIPSTTLIAASALITRIVADPESERLIRRAGGTGSYRLSMLNFYNQDYPRYNYPEAILTVSSPSPLETTRTFTATARVLAFVLSRQQRRLGVRPADRIVAKIIANSGPVAASGSAKRAMAGALLIAAVLGPAGLRTIDRHWLAASRGRHSRPGPSDG